MPNVELLRQTMDTILAHPERHNQMFWATRSSRDEEGCGTSFCFAGWACKLAGFEADFSRGWDSDRGRTSRTYWVEDGESIGETAAALLDLDLTTADVLFSATNTVADLKELVDVIAATGRATEEDLARVRGVV